jgi:hypothetical protein
LPTQWFFVPFIRRDLRPGQHGRWGFINSFSDQIAADGGAFDAFECGGGPNSSFLLGAEVAKVRAAQPTLNAIDADATIRALPATLTSLSTSLSVLTGAQRTFLSSTAAPALGYTQAEITAWLGGQTLSQKTFGQFLDLMATRWFKPVWEPTGTQTGYQGIVYPGVVACDGRTTTTGQTSTQATPVPKTPAQVDAAVQ